MPENGQRESLRRQPLAASLGASVRSRRSRLGISQEELAERAGLHRTYIAGIESRGRNITLKSVEKLAVALGTSVGALLAESERPGDSGIPGLLLIEDDSKQLEQTLEEFRRARLKNGIHVARDAGSALEFLFGKNGAAENPVHLVLLDLGLPKNQGLEMLRRLKSDDRTQHLPVVVLSDSRGGQPVREALQLGAAGHLVKPLDFQEFCRLTPGMSFDWTLFQAIDPPVAREL